MITLILGFTLIYFVPLLVTGNVELPVDSTIIDTCNIASELPSEDPLVLPSKKVIGVIWWFTLTLNYCTVYSAIFNRTLDVFMLSLIIASLFR
jgi:hypothetical protein